MVRSVAIIGTRGYPSYYGGFETAVRHVAPFLTDHGWEVSVYGRRGSTFSEDPARDERIASITTRGFETRTLSTLSYGLTSTLNAAFSRFDVALVMNVANGFWLPLLRSRGIPVLMNVDGLEWERSKWGSGAKALFRAGAKMSAKYADTLVFDSLEIGRRWQEEFRVSGVFIPYGGDSPGRELPVEPGLEHRDYVLMVARFVPENSVPQFLEIAAELAKRWHVVIVGSSGYGGVLDERAATLAARTDVRWLGQISDDQRLYALWQHAGVYFHGHSVGGTNPALVQAMACGAPTVARDTPYNREVLGENAEYTLPEPRSIYDAIVRVMESRQLQERLSAGVISRAHSLYSWDSVNAKYEECLEGLIRPRSRG